MTEFTGERVIPGQVEDDLWAEHMARYAFAARFAAGKRVLDVGCGAGYGAAELAKTAAAVTGVDVSADAIAYAAQHYPGVAFRKADARKLPFDVASFDLITAFELIEHLEDWRAMLHEVRRVLNRLGAFIVSTPNKLYYAEARGKAGPNPYHRHEFEYAEFRSALGEFFPHVRVMLQDRMESFGFYDPEEAAKTEATIERTAGAGTAANFFVAVCTVRAQAKGTAFLYVPKAANLLREREAHIEKLSAELGQVRQWLVEATAERDRMLAQHAEMEAHLEEKNRWAAELEAERARIAAERDRMMAQHAEMEAHLEEKNRWAAELEAERAHIAAERDRMMAQHAELEAHLEEKNRWAAELGAALKAAQERIVAIQEELAAEQTRAMEHIGQLEAALNERTEWARRLEAQAQELAGQAAHLKNQLEMVRQSRWLKAGRVVGLGPKLGEM